MYQLQNLNKPSSGESKQDSYDFKEVRIEHEVGCHRVGKIQDLEGSIALNFIPLCTSCVTRVKSLNLSGLQFPPHRMGFIIILDLGDRVRIEDIWCQIVTDRW